MANHNSTNREPSREFFQSSPRAKAIRDIGIEAFAVLGYILEFPDPTTDYYLNVKSQLESLETRFMDIGVEKDMQMNRPTQDYLNNPNIAAEYLAGQILNFSSRDIPNIGKAFALNSEFGGTTVRGKEGETEAGLVDLSSAPKEVREFLVFRDGLERLKKMFDVSSDELRPYIDMLID